MLNAFHCKPTLLNLCSTWNPVIRLSYFPSLTSVHSFSSLTDPLGAHKPPRRFRRWGRGLLLFTILSTASAAGLLYSKKYFRDLLRDYYPPVEPILKNVEGIIGGWYDERSASFSSSPVQIPHLPFLSKEKQDDQPDSSDSFEILPSTQKEPSDAHSLRDLPSVDDVIQMKREQKRSVQQPKISLDIEKYMLDANAAVHTAVASLASLESATRSYTDGLREAVKLTGPESSKKWERASNSAVLKDNAQVKADAAVDQATRCLDLLQGAIHHCQLNEQSLQMESLPIGIETYGKLKYDLSGAIYQVRKVQNELHMLMRYRDLVTKTHELLQRDLDSIREQTDLSKTSNNGSSLSVDELNALIVFANNRTTELLSRLADAEEKEKARLDSALEARRRLDDELMNEYVKRELDRERNAHELERHKWLLEAQEETSREVRLALARHSDHLSQMLRLKQDEMEHHFAYRQREALAKEKTAFEAALLGWINRMRAIEDVVDGRAELDQIAKETQALWITCEALSSKLSSIQPGISAGSLAGARFTGPLGEFVEAVRMAASTGNHEFVLTIIDQLSPEISQKGVWMERGLKERFDKVYKVCRRVALVDETGGSLFTYALSWLQSLLVMDVFASKYTGIVPWLKIPASQPLLIAEHEISGDDGSEAVQVDTFSILRGAQAALNMPQVSTEEDEFSHSEISSDDCIELAVRLMGQLRGQSRLVAADWLDDARRYLETRQAVRALLAYAAARGMSTFHSRL